MALAENLENAISIAGLIDHTLLKPEATRDAVVRLCREAREYSFASVCINPCWVPLAADSLAGSPVRTCTVVGFPLGANSTRTKIFETELALSQGAREIDMVQNIGALRSGDLAVVEDEIRQLASITHGQGALLKVILETCLLTNEQKRIACRLAVIAKADFVKTSTGFSSSGATADDVRLMRNEVGEGIGVKASGGVRTLPSVLEMVRAGANRIGTSSGCSIVRELEQSRSLSPASSQEATNDSGSRRDAY